MKTSPAFKKAINDHLQSRADNDPLFAETFKKPAKNIDDCITYILNEVKKTGQNAFADEEIYGMAVHYYDEDDIVVGKPVASAVGHKPEAKTKAPEPTAAPVILDKKKSSKKQPLIDQIPLFGQL